MRENTMIFDANTIYKDLIKSVHPDIHPDMPDATEKAKIVNGFKNNPLALKRIAIEWGYITGSIGDLRTIRNCFIHPPRRYGWVTTFSMMDTVCVNRGNYKDMRGTIVDKKIVTRNGVWCSESYILFMHGLKKLLKVNFRREGANSLFFNKVTTNDDEHMEAIRVWNKHLTETVTTIKTFNLTPNRHYIRGTVVLLVRIGGRTYRCNVIRTTNKCVVVDFFGKERIVRVNHIIERVDE
jgi:hypothetical protein